VRPKFLGIITTRGDGKFDLGDCKKIPIRDRLKETTNNPGTQARGLWEGGGGCSMLRRKWWASMQKEATWEE
jgi:hypothetical protein